MPSRPPHLPLGALTLDPGAGTPLYRQLYDALRLAILEGRLRPGARLPSSRMLAADLGIGRNTVLGAYEQLAAEGYLQGRIGAGTRVAPIPPDALLEAAPAPHGGAHRNRHEQAGPIAVNAASRLSQRGEALASIRRAAPGYQRGTARAFQHGLPAIDLFPSALWGRLLARHARNTRAALFGYETGEGFGPLREVIAAYLGAARAVICSPDQIIVTTGAQAALDLAARMVLDPGDAVWIEEPGYLGARGAFLAAGAQLVSVPVDREGLDIEAGLAKGIAPRLVYVTPSHQFPLGVTLSLPRRLALLELARRQNAWVIEDDYDSEYRYAGRPLASLQGLDRAGCVLYMGTFAKTLFPALRIGYLVIPDTLVDSFRAAIRITGHTPPAAMQAALADLIGEGHFGAHVRRMRTVYAGRRALMHNALGGALGAFLEACPGDGGMQIASFLAPGADDRLAATAAAQAGIHTGALSAYYLGDRKPAGLYLGYAGVPDADISGAAQRLAAALTSANTPKLR